VGGWAIARRWRDRVLFGVLGGIGALAALIALVARRRLGRYGSYEEFHAGHALALRESKLPWLVVVAVVGAAAAALAVARTLRSRGQGAAARASETTGANEAVDATASVDGLAHDEPGPATPVRAEEYAPAGR